MHEKSDKSIKKEKRQLQDLISNILERRRGPNKLIENILGRRKPPIMFTTNNANNPKPVEVFPGDAGANNPAAPPPPPRPNDGGVGNPFADLPPPPPPPAPALPVNQNPIETNLMPPFRDDPAALTAAQMQQRGPTPLMRQEEPNERQNVIQLLQNSGLPNSLIQQQMNNEQTALPQRRGPLRFLPLPLPFLQAPPVGVPPILGEQRTFMPIPAAPAVPPFGVQFPPMYPIVPRPPMQFPFYRFVFPQMHHFVFPPMNHFVLPQMQQPDYSSSIAPPQDSTDEDRPSVNVNVETSKSKIPKSKKS